MRATIKGWLDEKMITVGMWLKLDRKIYRRVNDVTFVSSNGTTQIDHVIVPIYGLFVIETRNMDGWIFGSANQETWTQQFLPRDLGLRIRCGKITKRKTRDRSNIVDRDP